MIYSVLKIERPVRRRLKRIMQRSSNREHARRAEAILGLWETGNTVSETARRMQASRSGVQRWRQLYESAGEAGLESQPRGREEWKATAELLAQLADLVRTDPTMLGTLRSRWSSELLAFELKRRGEVEVHATTIRRWLARLSMVWRRPRPTFTGHRRQLPYPSQSDSEWMARAPPASEVTVSTDLSSVGQPY